MGKNTFHDQLVRPSDEIYLVHLVKLRDYVPTEQVASAARGLGDIFGLRCDSFGVK